MKNAYSATIVAGLPLSACAEKRDGIYGTRVDPDRSNLALVTLRLGEDGADVMMRERALWIEDARSSDVFVDTR